MELAILSCAADLQVSCQRRRRGIRSLFAAARRLLPIKSTESISPDKIISIYLFSLDATLN
jgi:hypothetical protein